MYPYGNAHEEKLPNGHYAYDCQHGDKECRGKYHNHPIFHVSYVSTLIQTKNDMVVENQFCILLLNAKFLFKFFRKIACLINIIHP